ncbi:PREDICTED: uncharacterized protein LOC106335557 isoform X3 [Brassica oleracea var. oleracea]|uniref:uncharacterized protein LOC106335557 isoform X3 n=1 Tax=Brassica oleracea var. oleracea TaxID=109376 RepID=UPI0006A735DF|nr:PREDICTED: uncharacterized protein LOC106335557 isoform X3 [Brassica oleracea var. oleracea]
MALRGDEPEFMNLREWDRRARLIRDKQTSRRFSASYVGSFREDHHKSSSTRTNFNSISSTASSPGYTLKALQAKAMFNNREWLTQEGFALNSKWNEAEKYICNPLSGEVPMECLSSRTLSSRSFRNLATTMSAPLHYPNPNPLTNIGQNKPNNDANVRVIHEDLYVPDPVLVRAEKKVMGLKRDVGIQSTSVELSSGSPSPAKTPPIMERSLKRHVEANDSPVDFNLKLEGQQEDLKLEEKKEEKQDKSKEEGEEEEKQEMSKEVEEENQEMSEDQEMKKNKKRGSGCFSWVRSRQRQARKSKYIFPICVPHLVKGC